MTRSNSGWTRSGKRPLASPGSSGALNLAPPLPRLKGKTDERTRWTMVASTTPAAGGRRPSAAQTLAQTCPHALHATCLREWQRSVVTPGQRALLDTKRGARYAKSLRQLALAEYDGYFGGRCEACAAERCSRASVVSLTY